MLESFALSRGKHLELIVEEKKNAPLLPAADDSDWEEHQQQNISGTDFNASEVINITLSKIFLSPPGAQRHGVQLPTDDI